MRQTRFAVALLVLLAACGATARQRALDAALVSLDSARDGFVAYDSAKQAQIVERAQSREEGARQLAAWRAKRDAAAAAITAAYSALAAACLDAGPDSLAEAAFTAARAYQAIKDLQGASP